MILINIARENVNKLKANLSIRELSNRLKNTTSELERLHEMFSSGDGVYTKRGEKACYLNKKE